MKTLIAVVTAWAVLSFVGAWLVEWRGGSEARVNMDALPLEVLGLGAIVLDVGLVVVYALYRLLFT